MWFGALGLGASGAWGTSVCRHVFEARWPGRSGFIMNVLGLAGLGCVVWLCVLVALDLGGLGWPGGPLCAGLYFGHNVWIICDRAGILASFGGHPSDPPWALPGAILGEGVEDYKIA